MVWRGRVSQPLMDRLTVDVEEHLAHATEAGVEVLVLGPATMGEVMHLPAREAADLLENIHVEYAAAQRAHPDRLACLPRCPCWSRLSHLRCSTARSATSTCAACRF
jgi:hypothetical protein